jgi:hypothetical protein
MAVKIVEGYTDPAWPEVKEMFYDNFNPDDWDSITIAKTRATVKRHAEKRMVCDYTIKKVGDVWVAVNYHS